MAKAEFQPWMKGRSGAMGDIVFRQTKNGDTIISSCPDMKNVEWSPAQLAQRERFKEAAAYAKAAMADPGVRASYEKMAAKMTPRNMAIFDFFEGNNLLSK